MFVKYVKCFTSNNVVNSSNSCLHNKRTYITSSTLTYSRPAFFHSQAQTMWVIEEATKVGAFIKEKQFNDKKLHHNRVGVDITKQNHITSKRWTTYNSRNTLSVWSFFPHKLSLAEHRHTNRQQLSFILAWYQVTFCFSQTHNILIGSLKYILLYYFKKEYVSSPGCLVYMH